jgi:hypothetical protein
MKVKNKEGVIQAWKAGELARTKNRSLSTDGTHLMSYGKLIGLRLKSGYTIVGDYTARTKHFASQTTSCHVGLAARFADSVWHPLVFENSPGVTEHVGDLPF